MSNPNINKSVPIQTEFPFRELSGEGKSFEQRDGESCFNCAVPNDCKPMTPFGFCQGCQVFICEECLELEYKLGEGLV